MNACASCKEPCEGELCTDCAAVRVAHLAAEAAAKAAEARAEEKRKLAAREAEFYARLDRMLGGVSWQDGQSVGVKCTGCGQHYIFDSKRGFVHPGDGCPGAAAPTPLAEQVPMVLPEVRRTHTDDVD
jgi:hypothetical protein